MESFSKLRSYANHEVVALLNTTTTIGDMETVETMTEYFSAGGTVLAET